MLFGKKKLSQAAAAPAISAPVLSIPSVFYGGADPVIEFATRRERPVSGLQTTAPTASAALSGPQAIGKKFKILVLAGSAAFLLLFIAGATWYYARAGRTAAPTPLPPAAEPPMAQEPAPEIIPPPEPLPVTTTEKVVTTTLQTPSPMLGQFPAFLTADTPDLDADQLTDVEEDLLGTDSGVWDSDEDGYFDGQEVINLYNPKGLAPIKIIDSGLVREYIHPRGVYAVYFPASWQSASVDPASEQVIFSAVSGDFVEIRRLSKDPSESFEAWFARSVHGQLFTDVEPFVNRFNVRGWQRRDGLVAYLPTADAVLVVVYHAPDDGPIKFRHLAGLMIQSVTPGTAISGDTTQ